MSQVVVELHNQFRGGVGVDDNLDVNAGVALRRDGHCAGYRLPRLPDSKVCCAQSTKDVQAMSGLAVRRASMSTR
jgi:hypothetical protein